MKAICRLLLFVHQRAIAKCSVVLAVRVWMRARPDCRTFFVSSVFPKALAKNVFTFVLAYFYIKILFNEFADIIAQKVR
jgi:hypothetical protein